MSALLILLFCCACPLEVYNKYSAAQPEFNLLVAYLCLRAAGNSRGVVVEGRGVRMLGGRGRESCKHRPLLCLLQALAPLAHQPAEDGIPPPPPAAVCAWSRGRAGSREHRRVDAGWAGRHRPPEGQLLRGKP